MRAVPSASMVKDGGLVGLAVTNLHGATERLAGRRRRPGRRQPVKLARRQRPARKQCMVVPLHHHERVTSTCP